MSPSPSMNLFLGVRSDVDRSPACIWVGLGEHVWVDGLAILITCREIQPPIQYRQEKDALV